MNDLPAVLLSLLSVHLAVVLVPGPNFLMVVRVALTQSRSSALLAACGVASGTVIFASAGFLGFAAIIAQSPLLLAVFRLLGSAYLIYSGLQSLRRPALAAVAPAHGAPLPARLIGWSAYRRGLFTQLSNPKAAIYFLTLFTVLMPPDLPTLLKPLIVAVLVGTTLLWYIIVSLTFSSARIRAFYLRAARIFDRIIGLLFIALGLRVALGL